MKLILRKLSMLKCVQIQSVIARCVRLLVVLGLVAAVVMFVPTLRNKLLPVWPRVWRHLPTSQIIKVNSNTLSSDSLAALVSCTEPEGKSAPYRDRGGPQKVQPGSANKGGPTLLSPSSYREDRKLYTRAMKWVNSTKTRRQKFWRYLPQQTLTDKTRLLDTWRAFHHACLTHNISYFLVEGSLLGAFRHRGLIPWDDDMDVAVDVRDVHKLQRALACVPGHTLRVQSNMHWKFFPDNGSVVPVKPFIKTLRARTLSESQKNSYVVEFEEHDNVVMRYPFVDIFMVKSDDSNVWAITNYVAVTVAYRAEDVYPLTVTNFEGYLAPVPRHGRAILDMMYDFNVCLSPFHNHKVGKGITEVSRFPCQELAEMYPMYNLSP